MMQTALVLTLLALSVATAAGYHPSSAPTPRSLPCDAGASCGMCLYAIPAAECPPEPAGGYGAWPDCNSVAVGELCEGDNECGTTDIDQCGGGYDFYRLAHYLTPTAAPTEQCEPEMVPWEEHQAVLAEINMKKMRLVETKALVRQCERAVQRLPGYVQPTAAPTATGSPTASTPPAPTPSNPPPVGVGSFASCAHAAQAGITTSGVYTIHDPNRTGAAHTAYCDMDTDGGGWMLLYSYDHTGGQNVPLDNTTLPLSPTAGYAFFVDGRTVPNFEPLRSHLCEGCKLCITFVVRTVSGKMRTVAVVL